MEYLVKTDKPEEVRSDCVVAGVFQSQKLSGPAKRLDEASGGAIAKIVQRGDMEGRTGQTLLLHDLPGIPSERVLLVGLGKEKEFGVGPYRQAVAAAAKLLNGTGSREAALFLTELEIKHQDAAWRVHHAVTAANAALYRFDELKSKKDKTRRPLGTLTLYVTKRELAGAEKALPQAAAVSAGMKLASDLGNLPGNVCTPTYLAEQAVELSKTYPIKTTVLEQADMEELGMGALLSVSRGSRQPPKLIVMEYQGGKADDPPVALVGKGLTFDAGGISLKPAAAMDEMKYDMCGAASVFGTLQAAAQMELPINVVGIVPSSENLPDGDANKPGDIVTTMSGQTVEVLNTDAEGRLILCDALTYTERFKPAVVIDIATLTGACVVALGGHASGLLGNNERLLKDLVEAGDYSHDRAWQLPLWEDYQKQLDSNFADMANIGGREAGTITAACFLARYTKKFKWAHLDIAGTAWKSGKEKGATGRPVPLLTRYLVHRSGKHKKGAK
jgi:leucyl aminopeptidase